MRGDFSKRRPRSNNKFPGLDWVEDRQFGIWLGSAPGASLLPALYIALTMAGLASHYIFGFWLDQGSASDHHAPLRISMIAFLFVLFPYLIFGGDNNKQNENKEETPIKQAEKLPANEGRKTVKRYLLVILNIIGTFFLLLLLLSVFAIFFMPVILYVHHFVILDCAHLSALPTAFLAFAFLIAQVALMVPLLIPATLIIMLITLVFWLLFVAPAVVFARVFGSSTDLGSKLISDWILWAKIYKARVFFIGATSLLTTTVASPRLWELVGPDRIAQFAFLSGGVVIAIALPPFLYGRKRAEEIWREASEEIVGAMQRGQVASSLQFLPRTWEEFIPIAQQARAPLQQLFRDSAESLFGSASRLFCQQFIARTYMIVIATFWLFFVVAAIGTHLSTDATLFEKVYERAANGSELLITQIMTSLGVALLATAALSAQIFSNRFIAEDHRALFLEKAKDWQCLLFFLVWTSAHGTQKNLERWRQTIIKSAEKHARIAEQIA